MSTASAAAGEAFDRDVSLRALEENLWSLWAHFGRGPGCALVDEPGLLRFDMPIARAPYNAVLRYRGSADAHASLDAILAHYRGRGVPLMWVVHPTSTPADLPRRLAERGLVATETVRGMVRGLEDLPPPPPAPDGVEITEAGRAEGDDEEVVGLVTWRYGLSDEAEPNLRAMYGLLGVGTPGATTRIWVARRDGRAVSKVLLHRGGGAAGLHGVATRPEARGLGLARSLTLRALEAARAAGERLAVLHATPMAVPLYAGLGFRPVADFHLFADPDALRL